MRAALALFGLLLVACVDLRRPPELNGSSEDGGEADAPTMTSDGVSRDGGAPSDATQERPRVANGKPCAADTGCVSGVCVDGVCCATTCAGACRACNVAAQEGVCTPVLTGEDPDNDCGMEAVALCGLDGTCDGRGGCRRYAAGTVCAAGSCTGTTERAASTCDGEGACKAGTSRMCATVCQGASCGTSCATSAECQAGFYCGGTCVLKKATGQRCAAPTECNSGQCADGFCCNNECKQSCYACNLPGVEGTCTAVPSGQDVRNNCAMQAASTCARAGGCNGKGGCLLHGPGVECVAQTCSGSTEVAHSTCDGLGACQPGGSRDCGNFLCGAGTCRTTCTSTNDCKPGKSCAGGVCGDSNLVLRWKLDEASGTTALDSSGNGFNGTYLGDVGIPAPSSNLPPTRFPNPSSRAFDMDRRHAVRLAGISQRLRPARDITVSFWYRATRVDTVGSDAVNLGDSAFAVRIKATEIEWIKHDSLTSGNMFEVCQQNIASHLDGRWHHAAGVSDAAGLRFYLDGTPLCNQPSNTTAIYENSELWAGRNPTSLELDSDGNLDDIRIYDRALSPGEVSSLASGNE